mgnify:CR=1 FL=1
MNYESLIFDIDGTLWDSRALVAEGYNIQLKAEGLEFLEAEIQMVPQTYTALTNEDDIKNMEKMLEVMEANDDIQDVWHNWEE